MVINKLTFENVNSSQISYNEINFLSHRMKEEKVLIANDGPDKNVMLLLPPLCFTCENAVRVVAAFDKCLAEIENGLCPDSLQQGEQPIETTQLSIPVDILNPTPDHDGEGDENCNLDGPESKRAKYDYDDMD